MQSRAVAKMNKHLGIGSKRGRMMQKRGADTHNVCRNAAKTIYLKPTGKPTGKWVASQRKSGGSPTTFTSLRRNTSAARTSPSARPSHLARPSPSTLTPRERDSLLRKDSHKTRGAFATQSPSKMRGTKPLSHGTSPAKRARRDALQGLTSSSPRSIQKKIVAAIPHVKLSKSSFSRNLRPSKPAKKSFKPDPTPDYSPPPVIARPSPVRRPSPQFPNPDLKRTSPKRKIDGSPQIVELLDDSDDDAPSSQSKGSGKVKEKFKVKSTTVRHATGASVETIEFKWDTKQLVIHFGRTSTTNTSSSQSYPLQHMDIKTCTNNAITMTTKLFPFNDASAFKTFDFMLHDGEPNIKEMVEQRFFALRKGIKGPAAPEHVRRSPRLSARKSSRKTAAKRLFKYSVEGSADTLTISSIDLERMSNPTEFLNDNCIDFFIKTLFYGDGGSSKGQYYHLRSRVHCFNSLFFANFFKGKLPIRTNNIAADKCDYAKVKNWTKKVDIFDRDVLLIPICKSSHWSVVVVLHPSRIAIDRSFTVASASPSANEIDLSHGDSGAVEIVHLDSLGLHRRPAIIAAVKYYLICEYFERKAKPQKIGWAAVQKSIHQRTVAPKAKVPSQPNGYDCGMYVSMYVKATLAVLSKVLAEETNGSGNDLVAEMTWQQIQSDDEFSFGHSAVQDLRSQIAIHITDIQQIEETKHLSKMAHDAKSTSTRAAATSEDEDANNGGPSADDNGDSDPKTDANASDVSESYGADETVHDNKNTVHESNVDSTGSDAASSGSQNERGNNGDDTQNEDDAGSDGGDDGNKQIASAADDVSATDVSATEATSDSDVDHGDDSDVVEQRGLKPSNATTPEQSDTEQEKDAKREGQEKVDVIDISSEDDSDAPQATPSKPQFSSLRRGRRQYGRKQNRQRSP